MLEKNTHYERTGIQNLSVTVSLLEQFWDRSK